MNNQRAFRRTVKEPFVHHDRLQLQTSSLSRSDIISDSVGTTPTIVSQISDKPQKTRFYLISNLENLMDSLQFYCIYIEAVDHRKPAHVTSNSLSLSLVILEH